MPYTVCDSIVITTCDGVSEITSGESNERPCVVMREPITYTFSRQDDASKWEEILSESIFTGIEPDIEPDNSSPASILGFDRFKGGLSEG